MHSIRARPICRAHNSFSPSIALWQHFIVPNQHLLRRQPQSSFASEATQSRNDESLESNGSTGALEIDTAPVQEKAPQPLKIQRIRAGSNNFIPNRALFPKYRQVEERKQKKVQKGPRRETDPDAQRLKLLASAKEAYDSAEDYEGVSVMPIDSGVVVSERKLPWVIKNWEPAKSGEDRLTLEIQAFHEYIRPSRAESIARKHVIEQVRKHVREVLPEYILEVFGSERTGVAFAVSDIDLRLVPSSVVSDPAQAKLPPSVEKRAKLRSDLMRLHKRFRNKYKDDYMLPTVRWARYPLLSLQDRASGLDIQVVLANDTSSSREFMHRYMTEYPYLPQLYSVIKATMDVRGLSDVFRGGIGSYSLFMMIVATLKHNPHPRNDAAGALIHFLRFWSNFQAEHHGVSIEPPELFDKSEQVVMHAKAMSHIMEGRTPPLPVWMLSLRDPADDTNDLGRKTVAWKHVRKTFERLAEGLRKDTKQNTRPSLLAPFVSNIYGLEQAHRKRLTEFGRRVATENGRSDLTLAGIAMKVREAEAATQDKSVAASEPQITLMTQGVAKSMEEPAASTAEGAPRVHELEAVTKAIREGELANEQSAQEAEALESAREASQEDMEDGINPWLKEVEVSGPNETGQALLELLGADKKREASKQEK